VKGRPWLVLVVLTTAVATPACISPTALGQMHALRASDLLNPAIGGSQVLDAVATAQTAGAGLGAIFALIAALWSAHKARQGEGGWTKLMGNYLTGIFWAAFLIGAWGTPVGVDVLIREAGDELAGRFKSEARAWDGYFGLADQSARVLLNLDLAVGMGGTAAPDQTGTPPPSPRARRESMPASAGGAVPVKVSSPAGAQKMDAAADSGAVDPMGAAVAWLFSRGISLPMLALNGSAAYFEEILLQSVGAWLIVLYTIVGPMAAACLVLPATRSVFWGWMRAMCSLALWGALFGIAERVTQTVPAAIAQNVNEAGAQCGLQATCPITQLAEAAVSLEVSLVLVNIVLLTIYLSIPVAASMLVNAAGRPFKGAL